MQGQTVVVLGGSRGIGRDVARQAHSRGAQVIVTARGVKALAELTAELPNITTQTVDAIDESAVLALFDGIERVDHLYCAAGAFVGGSILDADVRHFRSALESRIWGAAYAVRAAAAKIPAGGSITLTGGISTDRPAPGTWATAVSTAAAEQMARVLSLELAPIRVNAVAPGWTDTLMWDSILGADKAMAFADVASKIAIGRVVQAAEVADAVLFLMNNRAVTGEVVHVDGGHRLV